MARAKRDLEGIAMCDLTSFEALMGTGGGLLAGAIAAVIVAAALNNGFFSAPGSPAAMITAGGLTLGAIAAISAAKAAAETYFQCMGAPRECAGEFANLMNSVAAILTVLGIQATACFVAAGFAWIPWAGAAPMYVILGAFIVQAALIPTIIGFSAALIRCAEEAAATPEVFPLSAVAGVLVVAVVTGVGHYFWNRAAVKVRT